MKRVLTLGIGALALIGSPAFAQEDDDWTGPYVGVHAGLNETRSATNVGLGGAWSTETAALRDFVTGNMAARQRDSGYNLGGQIGYNYQTGSLVVGIEAETSFFPGSETVSRGPLRYTPSPTLSYTFTNTIDSKNMSSIKAKAGIAAGGTLFYAEGGWAWTKARFATTVTSNANYLKAGELNKTMDGYIVGGGIEQRLGSNLSARVSYDYADQGTATYLTTYRTGSAFTSPAYSETVKQNLRLHVVKVGMNYRF